MSLRDAADWYRRGQTAVQDGRLNEAVDAFRRATARNRGDKSYVLALGRTLALNHEPDAAWRVLLSLRESYPEDRDVNLELARLAAERQDITEASRLYHNVLYAAWPPEETDARRGVRLELVRFLLTHDQSARAVSELMAMTDLPDEAPVHLEIGQLFVRAGDFSRALQHFQSALQLDANNAEALAGAGLSAFRLRQYALAQSYLHRASAEREDVSNARETVDTVLSSDPLASRIGSAERRRRLSTDMSYVDERFSGCAVRRADRELTPEATRLHNDLHEFEGRLPKVGALDQDVIEAGVDLIERVERYVGQACGPETPRDQALLLIARQHSADPK